MWGPLGIETTVDDQQHGFSPFGWNGLWGPLGIETSDRPGVVANCVYGWNGLWGPLGIETRSLVGDRPAAYALEWLVGPVRD